MVINQSEIVSFIPVLAGGYVQFTEGIILAIEHIFDPKIGARLVIKRGTKFIKPVFITIVTLTTPKTL